MKLAFDALHSGLGNNGGSRTIVRCAQVLESLGHTADIIATNDKLTWVKHDEPKNFIAKNYYDWIIAVASTDIDHTFSFADEAKRTWYMRAHENWNLSNQQLEKKYINLNGKLVLTNSTWQTEYLKSFGIRAYTVYQGVDLDKWKDLDNRNPKFTIGCLYHKLHQRKRWDHFVEMMNTFKDMYRYIAYGQHELKMTDYPYLSAYHHQPDEMFRNLIYNDCHVWFAPTENEGLHNPPLEASLCGCLLVCSDSLRNGMQDYAFENTAVIYQQNNIADMIYSIEQAEEYIQIGTDHIKNCQSVIKNRIGSREQNMEKLVGILQNEK
jgi:hypothetical protein